MNLGRAVLNSGSWKKIWTNYPNWIYTVKIFYHDVTFSRFAVGRNTLPKLGLKLTISWKSSLKGPDLQQSMIKGQFTKNGTFINILAILRPIWPQLCMLNKSASHLRTSFLVLVLFWYTLEMKPKERVNNQISTDGLKNEICFFLPHI